MTTPSDKQNQPALQPPELLPCSFCGRKALIEEFRDGDDPQPLFVATCEVCPVKTYDQFTAQEAARIWNTRASVGAATVQIPEGQWQHVGIKAGNPCVVAIKFETPEQATAFINQFAATDYIPDTRARVRDGGVAIVVHELLSRLVNELERAITSGYQPNLLDIAEAKRLLEASCMENDLQRRLYDECVTANWDPERRNTFAEEIAHLHEELSEAFRAFRRYKDFQVREVNGKLEGVPIEFADALIGMFYNAELHGFDLLAAIEQKHQFNLGRNYVTEGRQLHAPAATAPVAALGGEG